MDRLDRGKHTLTVCAYTVTRARSSWSGNFLSAEFISGELVRGSAGGQKRSGC